MKLKMRESDMKYKTYGNAERCFDILVKEKGYSRDEAQEILNNLMADYHYNPNSNQTLLRRVNQVLSKDEYEAEMEFARQNNPFKKEAYAYNLDNKESRRKEIADRFGKPFTPDDHMLVCKDDKLINIQVGKKYKCTAFNGQRVEIVSIDTLYPEDKGDSASITAFYRGNMYSIGSNQLYESFGRLHEQDVEIEVKHEGILEVPEGKNVDDLPISHFEKLAKKKGLSKITRALNNLQVWNKNDDPKLSKWAGDMIDKLNKRMGKEESYMRYNKRRSIRESKEDKYFVGCFRKASDRYDTNTYDEIFTTNSRSEAWEFALRYNMRGYYVEFNESDGYGDYNSTIYKPGEMVKDSNLINIKKESRSLGGRDYSYLDPVLQEYLDFLDEAGIEVLKVSPKIKFITVRCQDLDDASFYLQDRDYFGKDLYSKGWSVGCNA